MSSITSKSRARRLHASATKRQWFNDRSKMENALQAQAAVGSDKICSKLTSILQKIDGFEGQLSKLVAHFPWTEHLLPNWYEERSCDLLGTADTWNLDHRMWTDPYDQASWVLNVLAPEFVPCRPCHRGHQEASTKQVGREENARTISPVRAEHLESPVAVRGDWRSLPAADWQRLYGAFNKTQSDHEKNECSKCHYVDCQCFELYCRNCSKVAHFCVCGSPNFFAAKCEKCDKMIYNGCRSTCLVCGGEVNEFLEEPLFLSGVHNCSQCGGIEDQPDMVPCAAVKCQHNYGDGASDLFHSYCMQKYVHSQGCHTTDESLHLCPTCAAAGIHANCEGCDVVAQSSSRTQEDLDDVGKVAAVDHASPRVHAPSSRDSKHSTQIKEEEEPDETPMGGDVEETLRVQGYWTQAEFSAWVKETKALLAARLPAESEIWLQTRWESIRHNIPQQWHDQILALLRSVLSDCNTTTTT